MTDPNTHPEPQARAIPRWAKITLVLSLATNLLIIGAVGGVMLSRGDRSEARSDGLRGPDAAMIAQALPKEVRRDLRRDIRQKLRADPALREALLNEISMFSDLMRAAEVTPAAVEAQLQQVQSRMMDPLSVIRAVLAERLARFDAVEKAAYADRLDALLLEKRP